MISESHQQELLVRKFLRKTLLELGVIAAAHFLPAQILIDLKGISRIYPFRQQIGTIVVSPREMVGRKVDKDECRPPVVLLCDYTDGMIVEEAVGIGGSRAQLLGVEEMLDAGGGLEPASP